MQVVKEVRHVTITRPWSRGSTGASISTMTLVANSSHAYIRTYIYILENQQMRFPRQSLLCALRMTVATPSSGSLIVDDGKDDGALLCLWRVIIIY